MKAEDLQNVVPGFHDGVAGSQEIFRCALQALSMPGKAVEIPAIAQLPNAGHNSSALLLLALLDSETSLWVSSSIAQSDAPTWLRFHTGCRLVDDPAQAQFLWLARGDAWPSLAELEAGSDEYPDHSATCVMELDHSSQESAQHFTLSGPGIKQTLALSAHGLPADFVTQWADNHAAFPRGVDVLLTSPSHVLGLPRTTQVLSSEAV